MPEPGPDLPNERLCSTTSPTEAFRALCTPVRDSYYSLLIEYKILWAGRVAYIGPQYGIQAVIRLVHVDSVHIRTRAASANPTSFVTYPFVEGSWETTSIQGFGSHYSTAGSLFQVFGYLR